MKHLLKGGKVYDGTGSDAYIGDILFEDDRVLQVAPSIDEALADSVTDISGNQYLRDLLTATPTTTGLQ